MEKAKVYFTKEITPESLIELYKQVGVDLKGKTAVKVHSGEPGNQNFIRPEFLNPMKEYVDGTFVECNTAYDGERDDSKEHHETFRKHGWDNYGGVHLLDEFGEISLPVENGLQLDQNFVGKDIEDYDSLLVLSHFKGHPMGGYGGALKNISIGIASSHGKAYIHGVRVPENIWTADHDAFLESMADAAKTIDDRFKDQVVYINTMKNMSVDCDYCSSAEDPCMADIGVLASTDPVALDQACLDLIYNSADPGKEHLIERIESRNGIHTIEAAVKDGIGSREYDLIEID